MRLPGTGVGVARLVAVSMVKVDMARGFYLSSAPTASPTVSLPKQQELLFLPERRSVRCAAACIGSVDLELS